MAELPKDFLAIGGGGGHGGEPLFGDKAIGGGGVSGEGHRQPQLLQGRPQLAEGERLATWLGHGSGHAAKERRRVDQRQLADVGHPATGGDEGRQGLPVAQVVHRLNGQLLQVHDLVDDVVGGLRGSDYIGGQLLLLLMVVIVVVA